MVSSGQPSVKAGSQECCHFWVIDSPNGPISVGTCKWCGQTREFRNSLPSTGWERDHHHEPLRAI